MMKATISKFSLGCLLTLALGAHQAVWAAGNPVNGKLLYNDPRGSAGDSCADCHNADPAKNKQKILNGSGAPAAIDSSIVTNKGGSMNEFIGKFSASELDDLAAYLSAQPTTISSQAFASVGGAPETHTIQLTNTGGLYMTIANVSVSGVQAAEFVVSNNTCGASVYGGDQTATVPSRTCSIDVTFTPSGAASHQATMTIVAKQVKANGSDWHLPADGAITLLDAQASVALTGSVTSLSLTPNQLHVSYDTNSKTWSSETSVLRNNGTSDVTITSITPDKTNVSMTQGPNFCAIGTTLTANGGSCSIKVTATAGGDAVVTIATDAGVAVQQSLTVTVEAPPLANATTASLDSQSSATNQGGGGCTIAGPNAEFDPIWLSMLVAGGALRAWRTRRQQSVDEQV
jgi:cytochrome c553